MSGILAVGYFLITLFFSLLFFMLWARIALRYFHISTLHPISQGISKFSDPIIKPVAFLFAKTTMRMSRYDLPCLCILILAEFLKFVMISTLFLGVMIPLGLLPLYILADLITQPCNLLFYAIIIRVVISWVNPFWTHPVVDVIKAITQPLLNSVRSFVDFSPFIVMIALNVISLFISASLPLRLV